MYARGTLYLWATAAAPCPHLNPQDHWNTPSRHKPVAISISLWKLNIKAGSGSLTDDFCLRLLISFSLPDEYLSYPHSLYPCMLRKHLYLPLLLQASEYRVPHPLGGTLAKFMTDKVISTGRFLLCINWSCPFIFLIPGSAGLDHSAVMWVVTVCSFWWPRGERKQWEWIPIALCGSLHAMCDELFGVNLHDILMFP